MAAKTNVTMKTTNDLAMVDDSDAQVLSRQAGPVRPWAGRKACCGQRQPTLVIKNLSVRYGEQEALGNVSVSINRHCITAIVGPSGCGKSSFLVCLNRMHELNVSAQVRGVVEFDDENIYAASQDLIHLRRRVGMIFQKPNPLPLSIRKNLTLPMSQHGFGGRAELLARAQAALERVGLWKEVKDRLDTPACSLSGGQQQRLCIARALSLEPEVLLMDEPCSALDPIASGVVEDLIVSLRGRYTVVVVTHNLAQARRIADDVCMFWIRDGAGTLIEHGPAGQVFDEPANEITAEYLQGTRG